MQSASRPLNTPPQTPTPDSHVLGWAESTVVRAVSHQPSAISQSAAATLAESRKPKAESSPLPRRGDWAESFTHRRFWPLDPHPDDICVADIARGLSFQCRFGGHANEWMSIAQHSVICCDHAPPHLAPLMLMHDAPEAYIQDLIRPIKYQLKDYFEIERRWALVMGHKFGLGDTLAEMPTAAKEIDNRALMTERRDIKGLSDLDWEISAEPYPEKIVPWNHSMAEQVWLERFNTWFY